MNKLGSVFLLLMACTPALLFASPLSLCDYRAPETSITNARMSFSYLYSESAFDLEDVVSEGRLQIDFGSIYDTRAFGYTLSAMGELSLRDLRPQEGIAQSTGTLRYYLLEEQPLFGFGGYDASLTVGEPLELDLDLGVGYGRFSDVTPLAKAMRIQRLLLTREVLTERLPDDVLLTVAEEIGRRIEYETVEELVGVLVDEIEDAVGVQVDARSVLAMEDIVVATGDKRFCGWAVQAGLGYPVLVPEGQEQNLLLTARADLALAPEPGSQILLGARLSGPLNILEQRVVSLSASYEYAMGPGSTLFARATARRTQRPDVDPVDTMSASLRVNFFVGEMAVGVEMAIARPAGAERLSKKLSVSMSMKLL